MSSTTQLSLFSFLCLDWLGDGFFWGACIQVEGQVEEFTHRGNMTTAHGHP